MKKIIYLGMDNTAHEVFETAHVDHFKVIYQYENNNGKPVMLKATQDNNAFDPPHDHVQYSNWAFPTCKAGKLYPVNILDNGFSGHYFEIVEV